MWKKLESYNKGDKIMVNYIKDKVCYLGGHLLNQAMIEYREKQHDELEGIIGISPWSPHKDASINDKANAVQEGLAERIVHNDFKAMQESDIYVMDILPEGLGTIAELGIILGMKHQAQKTLDRLNKYKGLAEELGEFDSVISIEEEIKEQQKIVDKPCLCYCSDIRQGHGKPYNDPDRAEFSTNQFVYGCVLELTNGRGFISWEQIKQELDELANGKSPEYNNVGTKSNRDKRKYFNKKNKKKSSKKFFKRGK